MALHLRQGKLVDQRPWPAAELAEARRLRQGRQSAAQIGRKLGRTRNAVIAALWRAEEPAPLLSELGGHLTGNYGPSTPRVFGL
jgi:hypothetical protein